MSWHSGHSASHKTQVAQSSTRATRLLQDLLQPRGARYLSEPEMYSWFYYKTNIHPAVEAVISECGSTTRGERLTIVWDMARQCWEQETDEVIISDVKARMTPRKDQGSWTRMVRMKRMNWQHRIWSSTFSLTAIVVTQQCIVWQSAGKLTSHFQHHPHIPRTTHRILILGVNRWSGSLKWEQNLGLLVGLVLFFKWFKHLTM